MQEKAAGECIQLRKQYEKAQDIIKKEKRFVAAKSSVHERFQKTVQQLYRLQNCTFNVTAH